MQQLHQVIPLRAPGPVKSRPAAIEEIDPIQEQHMKVRVQVQRRAEALDQGDRTRPGLRGHCETCSPDQEWRNAALYHR